MVACIYKVDSFSLWHSFFSSLIDKNISSFLHDSGLDFSNQEAFRNIDESELDKYIFSHSDFESWHDMKLSATQEIISRQLKN